MCLFIANPFQSRTGLAVIHRIWKSYWINWHRKTNKSLSWRLNYRSEKCYTDANYCVLFYPFMIFSINTFAYCPNCAQPSFDDAFLLNFLVSERRTRLSSDGSSSKRWWKRQSRSGKREREPEGGAVIFAWAEERAGESEGQGDRTQPAHRYNVANMKRISSFNIEWNLCCCMLIFYGIIMHIDEYWDVKMDSSGH